MKELLEKLKKLDPETWKKLFDLAWAIVPGKEEGLSEYGVFCGAMVFRPLLMADRIQGEVQRACERHNWYWQAAHGECLGFMATVDGDCRYTTCGSSACHALLSAYIDCMEATA